MASSTKYLYVHLNMGFNKNTNSEKTHKAQPEATNDKSSAKDTHDDPKAGTLTSLATLLDDITPSKEDWPEEALRKVLGRFGKIPRTGQSRAHSVYCGKFNAHLPLIDFKAIQSFNYQVRQEIQHSRIQE